MRKLCLLLFVVLLCFVSSFLFSQNMQKSILILNSYHPGYKWTADIMRGILKELGDFGNQYRVHVEYMDTKRFQDKAHFQLLYTYYLRKYRNSRFDLIISSDDNAFSFLRKYRNTLFGGVPVVFCGVNYFSRKELRGMRKITGVTEYADLEKGISLIIKLHPKLKEIVIVNDSTKTGLKLRREIERLRPQYKKLLRIRFLEGRNFSHILKQLGALSPTSVVLYTIYFKDRAGQFFEFDESVRLVVKASSVPVYAVWDFSLGYGVVGGMLTSGFYQGQQAAKMALRVLRGESIEKVVVHRKSPNRYMFDYRVLRKWGIDTDSLPKDSFFIHRPRSFYKENPEVLFLFSVLLALLLLFLFLFSRSHLRRRHIGEQLREINATTEQKVVERTKELKQVVEELMALFENSLVGIVFVAQDNSSLRANRRFSDLIGYSLSEIVGAQCGPLCGLEGEDAEQFFTGSFEHALVQGECCLVRKDGSYVWCQVSGKVLDPADLSQGSVWVVDDITLRKNAQHELDARTRRLQFVLEGTNDGFWDWDIPGKAVFYSERFSKMFGYEMHELNYENNAEGFWQNSLHPVDRKKIRERLDEHLAGLFPYYEMEYRIKTKDGQWRWVLDKGRIAEYNAEGIPVRMTGLVTDITEKRAQHRLLQEAKAKAEAANAAKDKFFSIIAHDLRGPVGSFSHGVQYLLNKVDAKEQAGEHRVLDALWESSRNIFALLDNLLQWARAQSNRLVYEPVRVQLRSAVEDVIALLSASSSKKSIDLYNEIGSNDIVFADRNILQTVLRNLLSNAIKFTPDGGEVRFSSMVTGDFVEVTVADTGVGVSGEKMEKIFADQPYTTAGTSKEKGTGLGLLLCREFVAKSGGTIWYENGPDKGTLFHFTLPKF